MATSLQSLRPLHVKNYVPQVHMLSLFRADVCLFWARRRLADFLLLPLFEQAPSPRPTVASTPLSPHAMPMCQPWLSCLSGTLLTLLCTPLISLSSQVMLMCQPWFSCPNGSVTSDPDDGPSVHVDSKMLLLAQVCGKRGEREETKKERKKNAGGSEAPAPSPLSHPLDLYLPPPSPSTLQTLTESKYLPTGLGYVLAFTVIEGTYEEKVGLKLKSLFLCCVVTPATARLLVANISPSSSVGPPTALRGGFGGAPPFE